MPCALESQRYTETNRSSGSSLVVLRSVKRLCLQWLGDDEDKITNSWIYINLYSVRCRKFMDFYQIIQSSMPSTSSHYRCLDQLFFPLLDFESIMLINESYFTSQREMELICAVLVECCSSVNLLWFFVVVKKQFILNFLTLKTTCMGWWSCSSFVECFTIFLMTGMSYEMILKLEILGSGVQESADWLKIETRLMTEAIWIISNRHRVFNCRNLM